MYYEQTILMLKIEWRAKLVTQLYSIKLKRGMCIDYRIFRIATHRM